MRGRTLSNGFNAGFTTKEADKPLQLPALVWRAHIDAFFEHMAPRWSRRSLRTSAKILRAWFSYCERRGWARAGLADAILSPRVYREEGLPLGPTWDAIGRVLAETDAEDPASLRYHAIILLLSPERRGAVSATGLRPCEQGRYFANSSIADR
jgi:site-specific recombinase XerD